ncbi:MAG TPA: pseudouridine-5'-phosphate glycosidase [Bacilli bacterium]|nr:pseudouridine-5'-phosphate glycosidase [Bacilli bacterium]
MLIINKNVQQALKSKQAIVALESTIISHGMPYPTNVKVALEVEKTINDHGAVAATIGIIDGDIIVGMSAQQIEEFGKRQGIVKVSGRDLAYVTSSKLWGSTTVAATMIIAKMAGIDVFVTGGIGGVHRGAETTFDISNDLIELSKTKMVVVCAGPKAILDVEKTVEYLETLGVPLVGYQTDKLPLFYTRTSNINVPIRLDTPKEIAQLYIEQTRMNLPQAILVTNPIEEQNSVDHHLMDSWINKALLEAKHQGIKGKDETPFLLKEIVKLSKGESLEANTKLIINNAKLGAQIAANLAKDKA